MSYHTEGSWECQPLEYVGRNVTPDQEKKLNEVHDDVKLILQQLPLFVTWKQLGGVAVAVATLTIALLNVL